MRRYRRVMFAAVLAVLTACRGLVAETIEVDADVCVVGGGSGGIGAAVAAARAGARVVLVEQHDRLGGTSTQAYVCNWEPGPGCSIARDIFQRLRKRDAVGITSDRNPSRKQGPFGLWSIEPGLSYDQTLRRAGLPRSQWHAVVFDPHALSEVVVGMLAETGNCRLLLRTRFTKAETDGPRILAVHAVSRDDTRYRIRAGVFIDSTGGAALCRAVGCPTMLGPEPKNRFGEPSAPDEPKMVLNAISLCYRIRHADQPARQPAPEPPVPSWPHSAHVSALPGGDRIVNPLAMLPGEKLIDDGYDPCMAECRRIVRAHWRWLQGHDAFSHYEFHSDAPMLGIRESYRVVTEYVLTQHDVAAGLKRQKHADIVAVADHALDVHGEGGRRVHGELAGPYGIPYRCLIPRGRVNLLVACRGAGFSHVAASSCRLSRTMMALGHAAGLAAAQAARRKVPIGGVEVRAIQGRLNLPIGAKAAEIR